jgi:hypothetical protein
MRRITIFALGLGLLLASSLGGPRPASASVIFLDGGAGCTGYGSSIVYNGEGEAITVGCGGSSSWYLQATVYYQNTQLNPNHATCNPGWGPTSRYCAFYLQYYPAQDSIWADHNLCYAWCSGYLQTYDYNN